VAAINTLGLAKKDKIKRSCRLQQVEVYGDPEVHPQREDYWGNVKCTRPRACYDEGKRCAETLFMNYHDQNKVRIKIARIFNTYGPRMNSHATEGFVSNLFIVQAAYKGEDLTKSMATAPIPAAFNMSSDLIDGLIKLMDTPDSFTGPVNLGNPVEITIGSLAVYDNKNDRINNQDRLSSYSTR